MQIRTLSVVAVALLAAACIPPKTKEAPAPVVVIDVPDQAAVILRDLTIVVHDAAGVGIAGASCQIYGYGDPLIDGQTRKADGSGFIHFPVPGPVNATCVADGYVPIGRAAMPPGAHRIGLPALSIPPSLEPSPAPAPPVDTPASTSSACGADGNTGRVSAECLEAVARGSKNADVCKRTGDQHVCHQFVREVAIALRSAQDDERWGLIAKTKGGANVDGYGEDIVAYLPLPFPLTAKTNQWLGLDVIGGIGEPNARINAGTLRPFTVCGTPEAIASAWCNRDADLWAPVPR